MDQLLNDVDVRVLGALIEKEITTPGNYPLSLNALVAACNQSSNRTPVVAYTEETVLASITRLRHQSHVRGMQRMDARVTKYEHLAAESLNLTVREQSVLCVLMLRGPNTVGELRIRTERLADFTTIDDVETTLQGLIEREPAPLVVRMARQPGQKELRYAHLLSGEAIPPVVNHESVVDDEPAEARMAALEVLTAALQGELAQLREQFAEFRRQFE